MAASAQIGDIAVNLLRREERTVEQRNFDWSAVPQLSTFQLLAATCIPSALGFLGFHVLTPMLVAQGMPPIFAWCYVASMGLLLLVGLSVYFLMREAQALKITFLTRSCFRALSLREGFKYAGLFLLVGVLSAGAAQTLVPLLDWIRFDVPEYMPFFLNPRLDPATTELAILVPGVELRGNYGLFVLIAVTIFLNVLAEELYFRAWMLPKLHRFGKWSWGINGVLFAFYHTFQLWILPVLLVGSLGMAYIFYKSRSIWPTLIGHFVFNFVFSVLGILLLILGFGVQT